MGVGIERPLLGESRGGPVLPPVEIPLKPLVQGALVAVEVSHPGVSGLLIRALQIAPVIDLETGPAALVARLPPPVRAPHPAEEPLLRIPPEGGARRVVG